MAEGRQQVQLVAREMPISDSQIQWRRFLPIGQPVLEVRARVDEDLRNVYVTKLCDDVQGALARDVLGVWVRPKLQQAERGLRPPGKGRVVNWAKVRQARVLRLRVHVGRRIHQRFDDVHVAPRRGKMNGHHARLASESGECHPRVHISASLQHRLDIIAIGVVVDRIMQKRACDVTVLVLLLERAGQALIDVEAKVVFSEAQPHFDQTVFKDPPTDDVVRFHLRVALPSTSSLQKCMPTLDLLGHSWQRSSNEGSRLEQD
mmetsp:Transcript_109207/g.307989  ORF Transcript_109207/g.307989 Transcript_109207/m.307989 type:complete len:261 (-) Transcript_109207:8-790(-)